MFFLLEDELAARGRIGVVDVVAVVQIEAVLVADELAQAVDFDGEGELVADERVRRLVGRRLDPQPEGAGVGLGHLQVRQHQLDAVAHRVRRADRQRLELQRRQQPPCQQQQQQRQQQQQQQQVGRPILKQILNVELKTKQNQLDSHAVSLMRLV